MISIFLPFNKHISAVVYCTNCVNCVLVPKDFFFFIQFSLRVDRKVSLQKTSKISGQLGIYKSNCDVISKKI